MSIVLEGVTKRYGTLTVVDDIRLEVTDGELYVLLGESGSGKSTILRLIAGLTPLDRGRILLRDRDVTNLPPQQRGTGIVFQNYSLFQHMTVAQNVEFGLMIRKTATDQRKQVRAKLLEMVGLAGLDDRFPSQLSGGQQQRVALVRALAYQPDVLLLDEPFGALDAKTRGYLRRELRRIQQELKMTMIFVTHDREEAFELADRVGVLLRGRLVASGAPQTLYTEPTTPYVASLLGESNFLLASVREEGLKLGEVRLPATKAEIAVEQGRQAFVHFRPEDVDLRSSQEDVAGQPLGPVRITESGFAGAHLKLRLELDAVVQRPAPRSPADEEFAGTITALLRSDSSELLNRGQLWAGVKRYRILPRDPLRVVAAFRSGEWGRAVLNLARRLDSVEAIEVRVLMLSRGRQPAVQEVGNWDELEILANEKEKDGISVPDSEVILANLDSDLPDMLLLDRPGAMHLFRTMTSSLDSRLRRYGTAVVVVPSQGEIRLRRILVATAAGGPGRESVRFAARLARRLQAEVALLHVFDGSELPLDLDALASRGIPQAIHLKRDAKLVETLGIPVKVVLHKGDRMGEILRAADSAEAGILVIGAPLPRPGTRRRDGDLALRIAQIAKMPTAILYAQLA